MSLIAELKRRKVFKVGGAYLVVAWLAIQAASIAFPTFDAPAWALRVFIFVLLLGFPLALVISWILDVTPEGLRVEPTRVGTKRMMTIAAVLGALAIVWYLKGQPTFRGDDARPRALAVLPFASLGQDADSSGMAGGLHDTLITQLSKLKGLEVRSRTSVMKYKDWTGGLKPIAKELGVSVVLEGTVQHQGNRTVVNAQLINALTDAHLWAETIDRSGDDLFALQAEIAQKVADELRVALSPEERKALSEAPTQDREAYALFVQGQRMLNEADLPKPAETRDSERKHATELFEAAVAKDPKFALAWSNLSRAYATLAWDAVTGDYRAYADKARRAAERAVAFGAELPEARFARASVALQLDFDFPLAMRELEYATRAAPGIAEFHSHLCLAYRYNGRFEDSERSCRKALALDPTNYPYARGLQQALLRLRRSDDALLIARESATLHPDDYFAAAGPARLEADLHANLAPLSDYVRTLTPKLRKGSAYRWDLWLVNLAQGDYAAALAAVDEVPADERHAFLSTLRGEALRRLGRGDEARAAYAAQRDVELKRLGSERDPYVEATARTGLAYALARLGDSAGARENIVRADQLWGHAREPSDGAKIWFFLIPVHAALGEYDEACAKTKVLLEQPSEYPPGALWLFPLSADLHDQPCFRALMQAHGVDVSREPFAFNRAPKPAAGP